MCAAPLRRRATTDLSSWHSTVTGQGAGAAAAASIDEGKSTHRVSLARVQEELVRQGVRLF
jgi:hypothetical protein